MKILIADDEAPAREKLRRLLHEADAQCTVVEAVDGLQAYQLIEQERPDVAILDIQMPQLSGLDIAAQLDAEKAPRIVFVTAFDEHAVKAFELNAIDYLLKPYDRERFFKMWTRIKEGKPFIHRATAIPLKRMLVPQKDKLLLLDIEHIYWIESDDNDVHLHCAQQQHTLRRSLQDLLSLLPAQQFVRVHKSAAVNLLQIAQLEPLFKGDYDIVLKNGHHLRMSRRYKDELFARLS